MALDPVVLKSISKYKGKVLRRQLAIVTLPIIIAIVTAIVMLAGGWLHVERTDKGESPFKHPAPVVSAIGIFLAMPLGLYLGIAAYQRKTFKMFVISHMLAPFDPSATRHFTSGLEGASIAAGIDAPDLVMMDIPGLASLSFQFARGETETGVTLDTLSCDLTDHEAQALMAREVATILMNDQLKAALWFSPERAAAFMPTLVYFLMCIVGILLNNIPFLLVATGLMFVVFITSYVTNIYEWVLKRLFRGLEARDELLADSIAVKLTVNPRALYTAIEKLSSRGLLGYPQPTLKLVAAQISNLFRLPGHGIPGGLNYPVFKVMKPGHADTLERLRNLHEIERGNWRAFNEVVEGEVIVRPTAWK